MIIFDLTTDLEVYTNIKIEVMENFSLSKMTLTVNCTEIEIVGELAERIFKAVQIRVENKILAILEDRREKNFHKIVEDQLFKKYEGRGK